MKSHYVYGLSENNDLWGPWMLFGKKPHLADVYEAR